MGRDAKSREAAKKKVDFVTELVKGEPSLTLKATAQKVKEKFGQQLAPYILRPAFLAAGGKIGKRGRPKGTTTGTAEEKSAKRTPQQARRKLGRRKADRVVASAGQVLSQLPQHIIVVRTEDGPQINEFNSLEAATSFVRKQVEAGVPVASVAYYQRGPIEITIGL